MNKDRNTADQHVGKKVGEKSAKAKSASEQATEKARGGEPPEAKKPAERSPKQENL